MIGRPPRSPLFPSPPLFRSKKVHVLVDETRPRLQGARLTAWELKQAGISFDLISDNAAGHFLQDRKSTRLNSSHANISYAVFCLKKKTKLACLSACPPSSTL